MTKSILLMFFAAASLVNASAYTNPPQCQACTPRIKIEKGTTCYTTFLAHGFKDLTSFLAINPGVNCDKLKIGDELCVYNPLPQCGKLITLVKDDTCYELFKMYGISAELFAELNPKVTCGPKLEMGRKVCVKA